MSVNLVVVSRHVLSFLLGVSVVSLFNIIVIAAGLIPTLKWVHISLFVVFFAVFIKSIKLPNIGQLAVEIYLRYGLLLIMIMGVMLCLCLLPKHHSDFLGYHKSIPLEWINSEGLTFFPRAATGAIPLNFHAYITPTIYFDRVYAVGVTYSVFLILLLVQFHRFLSQHLVNSGKLPSLLTTIFISTPAIIYSGTNGDIDVVLLVFAFVSFSLIVFEKKGSVNGSVLFLSGVLAGFYAGSKYFGLFFCLTMFLYVISSRRFCVFDSVKFLFGCLLSGSFWYCWNYTWTGDPVFPILHTALPQIMSFWDSNQSEQFSQMMTMEQPLAKNVANFFLYFLYHFLGKLEPISSRHIGPSVFILVSYLAPILIMIRGRLSSKVMCTGLFFLSNMVLWFFVSSSQRFRYLLPLYPVLFIFSIFVFMEIKKRLQEITWVLIPIILLQSAYLFISAGKLYLYYECNASVSCYHQRVVPFFNTAQVIKDKYPNSKNILTDVRTMRSLLDDRNIYVSQPALTNLFNPASYSSTKDFWSELTRQNVQIVISRTDGKNRGKKDTRYEEFILSLRELGCIYVIEKVKNESIGIASLQAFRKRSTEIGLIYGVRGKCYVFNES